MSDDYLEGMLNSLDAAKTVVRWVERELKFKPSSYDDIDTISWCKILHNKYNTPVLQYMYLDPYANNECTEYEELSIECAHRVIEEASKALYVNGYGVYTFNESGNWEWTNITPTFYEISKYK